MATNHIISQQPQQPPVDALYENLIMNIQRKAEEHAQKLAEKEAAERLLQQQQQQQNGLMPNNYQYTHGGVNGKHNGATNTRRPLTKATQAYAAKSRKDQSLTSQSFQFTMLGRFPEFAEQDPLKEGTWSEAYTSNRDSLPTSPWRSMYEKEDGIRSFFDQTASQDQGSPSPQPQSAIGLAQGGSNNGGTQTSSSSSSKLVPKLTSLKWVQNTTPFVLGVFMANAPVSRQIENALFQNRVAQIKESYSRFQESSHTDGASVLSSLDLVTIVHPGQSFKTDVTVFNSTDTDNIDLSSTNIRTSLRFWSTITRASIQHSIIVENVNNEPNSGAQMSYISPTSSLAKIISAYWPIILRDLAIPEDQAFPPTVKAPARFLGQQVEDIVASSGAGGDDPGSKEVYVVPIPWRIVDRARTIAYDMLSKLPFANLGEHQFYVARLCGDSWDDYKGSCDPKVMQKRQNDVMEFTCEFFTIYEVFAHEPSSSSF